MRFKVPPNWPPPPPGWSPPPGWRPDPRWPAPPPGWQFWELESDTEPHGSPALRLGADHLRHVVARRFLLGLGAIALGSATTLAAVDAGGIVWSGGFLVGGLLIWSAVRAYRASLAMGAPPMDRVDWLGVGSGALVAAALAMAAGTAYMDHQNLADMVDAVGSCWADRPGSMVEVVACDDEEAAYMAVTEVADVDDCPFASDIYVHGRPGFFLCLVAR